MASSTTAVNQVIGQVRGLIRTMRPRQWVKNGFIFVALVFDRKLFQPEYLLATIAGFALFSLAASTVYLINDVVDIDADRAHPTKRNRPLPSGQLSKTVAIGAAVSLPLIVLPLSFLLRPSFGFVVAGYLLLQLAYSFQLKHIVILDVMAIAAGFVLRVVAGVVLVDVLRFSPWLYVFTTGMALFLGFGKRRQELDMLKDSPGSQSRAILEQYSITLLDELLVICVAMSLLTYSLYTFSSEGLPSNNAMMLTIPFVIYGFFRYLYLIHVRGEGHAPDEVILHDRPMQITVGLWGLAAVLILYVSG
ncbi:MAG: decaprenyl-phosphate phosphoribosyltransferase [Chloroflexi bacterium]|nr:decaprenyl-phosphate phosphoribosyltransferase [Chloroflexota bacterium]